MSKNKKVYKNPSLLVVLFLSLLICGIVNLNNLPLKDGKTRIIPYDIIYEMNFALKKARK